MENQPPVRPDLSPPRTTDIRIHTALLAVQLSFAGLHVVGKLALEEMTPLVLVSFRVAIATPILLLLAWRHDRILPRRDDLPLLALLGLLGICMNQVLYASGLRLTTATNAAVLMLSVPVFAVALAALFRVEQVGWVRLTGVLLAVAGALVILNPTSFSVDRANLIGNLLILANGLSYSVFLVLHRPMLKRLPWRTLIAWTFVFGSMGVLALGMPDLLSLEVAALSNRAWLGVLYIALFPTAVAYSINTWAVRRSTSSLVAAYITLQPLLTALLAAATLGEKLTWSQAVGFLFIATGLWRVGRRRIPR